MADTRTGAALTDGTGVSPLTLKKLVKDFVADFLMTAAAAVAATGIMGIPTDQTSTVIIGTAVLGAAIRAGYRAVLRWATTE